MRSLPRINTTASNEEFSDVAAEENLFLMHDLIYEIKTLGDMSTIGMEAIAFAVGSLADNISEFLNTVKENVENKGSSDQKDKLKEDDQVVDPEKPPERPEPNNPREFKMPSISKDMLTNALLAALIIPGDVWERAIEGMKTVQKIVSGFTHSIMTVITSSKAFQIIQHAIHPFKQVLVWTGKMLLTFADTVLPLSRIFLFIGKLIPFVQIISGIISFVKGFVDGFDEEGLYGGFKEGFARVAESFIGWPVEMLSRALAWVLKEFGFEKVAQSLEDVDFIKGFGDSIRDAADYAKELFDFSEEGLTFEKLQEIVTAPISIAIGWVYSIFGWETPTGEHFVFRDFVNEMRDKAFHWLKDQFTFYKDRITDEIFSLTDYAKQEAFAAFDWFIGKFTFYKENMDEIPGDLMDLSIKAWTGIFSWFKARFAEMTDPEEMAKRVVESRNFLADLVVQTLETVKQWFIDLFDGLTDALPSIDDVLETLKSKLPKWMLPEEEKSTQQIIKETQEIIQRERANIDRSLTDEDARERSEVTSRRQSARAITEATDVLRDSLSDKGISEERIIQIINNINNGGNVNTSTAIWSSPSPQSDYRAD